MSERTVVTSTITILAGLEPVRSTPLDPITQQPNIDPEQQILDEAGAESPAKVKQIAQDITVRVTAANNGGSGVLIAKKGNSYLVLTNAHVTRRSTQFEIQAPDGQKYTATAIDGGFDRKYDLALLEFTTPKQYQLANLANPGILKPNDRNIYSAGFPFDSKDLRISPGAITQLSDIPFDNGTQIGYEIAKGEKGVRQGMSGGPIFDTSGVFLGINTIGAAPILPNYTYNDGSKPLAKLAAKYRNTSISYGGMSGGAVFDTEGKVIGIHGQAETTEKAEILLGNSQGISIKTFIGIADKLKVKPQLLKIANNKPAQLNVTNRQTIITAMENLTPPQPEDDGERWLAYGNQLFRTLQYDRSVTAFDTAIAKGKDLTGNYGKALSLIQARKHDLAEIAIARAIAAVPASKRANYYYFWRNQSFNFRESAKYEDALKAINIAIKLEPNDSLLSNEKATILSKSKKYLEAIAIYTDLIRTKPEAYAYYSLPARRAYKKIEWLSREK
jgi:S1-C subfamily serine protease